MQEIFLTFAEGHITGLWAGLSNILNVVVDGDVAMMPLFLRGMGLRDAVRTTPPVFWDSWADWVAVVFARHPDVATLIIHRMRDPVLSAWTWHSSWSVVKGSSPLRGISALRDVDTKITNQEGVATAGNSKLLHKLSANTEDG